MKQTSTDLVVYAVLNQTLQLLYEDVRATLFQEWADVEDRAVGEGPAMAVSEQPEQANPKTYERAHRESAEWPAGLTELTAGA